MSTTKEPVDLIIRGARILDPANSTDCVGDVLILDGELKHAGSDLVGALPADRRAREIKADGLWLTPGWLDIHTHFREPGQEWKEDIASGSLAAVQGGVTTVVCMANTSPVLDNPAVCDAIRDRAEKCGLINLYMYGACSVGLKQEKMAPLGMLASWGVVGFSDDGKVIQNGQFMRRVMEYARTFGLPVAPHAEDCLLRQDGSMNEGVTSWELGHTGNPAVAEEVMVARDLALAQHTGCHLHLPHISTAAAVELIRRAKERGTQVTAEACPHHFRLTEAAVAVYGTYAKMAPPLRTEKDRLAIVAGLVDGTLDCIATDHAPHAPHEKEVPFSDAPFGIIGLQTLLPQSLLLAAEAGLSPLQLVRLVTERPAAALNLPHGKLVVGSAADLVLIDPDQSWTLDTSTSVSKSRNSPWWGVEQTGRAVLTVRRGQIVHDLMD